MTPIHARIQHRPLAVAPQRSAWFESCLTELSKSDKLDATASASEDFWDEDAWESYYRPYTVIDGVLQIPVKGSLLHDFPYQFGSYCTGYEYITEAVRRGVADSNVSAIALMIDSPGGMVAGLLDTVDRISAAKTDKPIQAFVESCYSAAFAIASVADKITVTRSGGVGSVGVVTMHVDMSQMLSNAGYKVTYIFAGDHKVDGNPYEPLPADVKERIQAEIDASYEEFVALVATNRGLTPEAVKATEAQCFMPAEALTVGFADAIGPMDESFSAFAASFNLTTGVLAMAEKPEAVVITQATVDAARADGEKTGRAAERERIGAILGSDEAKTRPAAAQMLAFDTDKDADSAKKSLARLPEETKPAAAAPAQPAQGAGVPTGMFTAAMDATQNPNLTAGDGKPAAGTPEDRVAARSALIRSAAMPGFRDQTKTIN